MYIYERKPSLRPNRDLSREFSVVCLLSLFRTPREKHLLTATIFISVYYRRSLEHFASCLQNAISSVEPENGGGELTVKLPKEAQRFVSEKKTFRLSIEFSLEHPEGGIQFVIPSGNGTMTEVFHFEFLRGKSKEKKPLCNWLKFINIGFLSIWVPTSDLEWLKSCQIYISNA